MMTDDRDSGGSGARKFATTTYAVVLAILALLTSGTALVFTLWPGLKPDPRERVGASLSVFTVEPGVAYEDWVRRTARDDSDRRARVQAFLVQAALPGQKLTARDERAVLRVRGSTTYVKLSLQGFKRRDVVLRWSLYVASTRRRVASSQFQDVAAAAIDLEAPTDSSVVQLWIPPVPQYASVFLRTELLSRNGALLAVADSSRFKGAVDLS